MTIYRDVVFLQGEDADPYLRMIDEGDAEAVYHEFIQWDMDDDFLHESEEPSWGSSDSVLRFGDYALSYNSALSYIGLTHCCTV